MALKCDVHTVMDKVLAFLQFCQKMSRFFKEVVVFRRHMWLHFLFCAYRERFDTVPWAFNFLMTLHTVARGTVKPLEMDLSHWAGTMVFLCFVFFLFLKSLKQFTALVSGLRSLWFTQGHKTEVQVQLFFIWTGCKYDLLIVATCDLRVVI